MLTHSLNAIRAIRPQLGTLPRAVVEAVLWVEGPIGSAHAVAAELGLPNRFSLARLLKGAGLPSLHRLAEWTTVLSWVVASERDGSSLCRLAFRSGRHPSACYRLVREVTGLPWQAVRQRGAAWVERQLIREVRRSGREAR